MAIEFNPFLLTTICGVCLVLVAIALYARWEYAINAGKWLEVHAKWLDELGEKAVSEVDWPQPPTGLPAPLEERLHLLTSPSVTSLADGDLGRFLLRRPEIKGQAALGSIANLLISIALASTILGLIVTLFGLMLRMTVNSEMKNMVLAISHFPWFFIPTFAGILLGAWANKGQTNIDTNFEQMWDQIDNFTIVHLLPKYIKPKSALDAATEKLMQAAGLFESSGQRLAGTIGQLESATSKLAQLDPTQWAVGLKDTSEKFERATQGYDQHVETLGDAIKGFGKMLEQQEQVTGANSQSISDVTALVKEASGYKDELAKTLLRFQESVEKVDGLRIEIQQFGSNVSSLGPSLENWSRTQDSSTTQLIREVANITKNVKPLLDEWKQASGFFSDNHQTFKAELEKLVVQFNEFQDKFEQYQTNQVTALKGLTSDFSKGAIEYWRSASSELNEKFDPPEILRSVADLAASLEGIRPLGTALPELTEVFAGTSVRFTDVLSEGNAQLVASVERLSAQQQAHQQVLNQVGVRLTEISEQLARSNGSEAASTPPASLSSRTILGLPIGPPPWMTSLLEKFSKASKR